MSTGLFMGIRGSYIDDAQASAIAFLDAINRALSDKGVARYLDPQESPNVYKDDLFGRSELGHHSSRVLVEIAGLATGSKKCPNLSLIRDNPYRVTFCSGGFRPSPADGASRADWRQRGADLGRLVTSFAG